MGVSLTVPEILSSILNIIKNCLQFFKKAFYTLKYIILNSVLVTYTWCLLHVKTNLVYFTIL